MDEHDRCFREEEWGKLWATLENIEKRLTTHVVEGEKEGGWRDRLLIMEQEVCSLKKAEWIRLIIASLIGGLLGKLSPDLVNFFAKMLMAGQ